MAFLAVGNGKKRRSTPAQRRGHSQSTIDVFTSRPRSLVRASHFDISSVGPDSDPVESTRCCLQRFRAIYYHTRTSITLLFTIPFIFWQLLGDLSSGEPFQLKTKVKKVRQLCDRTTLNGSVRSVGDEDLDEVRRATDWLIAR
jgi:hypothetical protein